MSRPERVSERLMTVWIIEDEDEEGEEEVTKLFLVFQWLTASPTWRSVVCVRGVGPSYLESSNSSLLLFYVLRF